MAVTFRARLHPPSSAGAARAFGVFMLIAVILVALYLLALYTSLGRRLVASLFPAVAPAALPSGPAAIIQPGEGPAGLAPEVWYPPEVDASRCYIDLDPDAKRETAEDGAVEINCQPRLPTRLPYRLFALRRQASSHGRVRTERIPCVNEAALPPCCVPDRAGLQANADATAAAAEGAAAAGTEGESPEGPLAPPSPRDVFGMVCGARYGCESDPVYARGVVPWLPDQPLNCFAEANTNTCVQLLLERVEPGTWSVNPALRQTDQNRERLRFLCENDARTTGTVITRGSQVPRMTPAELHAECVGAGFPPRANPGERCPAAGRFASERSEGGRFASERSEGGRFASERSEGGGPSAASTRAYAAISLNRLRGTSAGSKREQ